MLIATKIFYRNPKTEELVGEEVQEYDEFVVDLTEVSGIAPYDGGKHCCLFLNGRDVTITEGYNHIKWLWAKAKNNQEIQLL